MTDEKTPAPTRGVPVMLDKERRLRYSFKTRRTLIEQIGEEKLRKMGGDDLCTVLWYGLKHEDPDLTVDQLEEMVDLENLTEIVDAMTRAMGYKGKSRVEFGEPDPPEAAAPSASQ